MRRVHSIADAVHNSHTKGMRMESRLCYQRCFMDSIREISLPRQAIVRNLQCLVTRQKKKRCFENGIQRQLPMLQPGPFYRSGISFYAQQKLAFLRECVVKLSPVLGTSVEITLERCHPGPWHGEVGWPVSFLSSLHSTSCLKPGTCTRMPLPRAIHVTDVF